MTAPHSTVIPTDSKSLAEIVRKLLHNRIINKIGCWEWTGSVNSDNYGKIKFREGCKKYSRPVHRVAFAIFVGPIKEGLLVLHKCDNPRCFNPDHLFIGTQKDNIRDCMQKGRKPLRELSPFAKLTTEKATEIRQKFIPRKYSTRKLAQEYGVSQNAICRVLQNRTWKITP